MNGLKPRRTGMVVAGASTQEALHLAMDELGAGFFVAVCSLCVAPEVDEALKGFANVSHGYCEPCLDLMLQEAGRAAVELEGLRVGLAKDEGRPYAA